MTVVSAVAGRHASGVYGKSVYRPEIDGVRALAVIAVLINHLNKAILPSGYLGVDIFFVISGYVITSSLAGRTSSSFADFVADFYNRRIKRLIPALIVFVLIIGLLICLFNPNPGVSLRTGITALFGASNMYLFLQATDYFADSTELNVFTHTWSLGVEEQFYLLFPILIWLTGFGRGSRKGPRNLFLAMSVLSLLSLALFVHLYPRNPSAAYFLMPTRWWEMGVGCILFLVLKRFSSLLDRLRCLPPLTLTGGMILVMFLPLKFAVGATVLMVVLTLCLIASLRKNTAAYALFTQPGVLAVGLISYSLYLWHWGVLSLSRWTIGLHWWSIPFQVALIFILAIASYRYIETPLRRMSWAQFRWKTIGYGCGASVSAAGLLFGIVKNPSLQLYTGVHPKLAAVGVASLTEPYALKPAISSWSGEHCVLSDNSQAGKKRLLIEDCTLGNFATADRRILVIGNSFSSAFVQGFDDLVLKDNYAVTLTSSWGASEVKEIPNRSSWDRINDYYWADVVPGLVAKLKPGDWVFLINDMALLSPEQPTAASRERLAQLRRGLQRLSTELSERGISLAVLHGNPFAREAECQPATAADQWFTPFGTRCSMPGRTASLVRRKRLDDLLTELEAQGRLTVVDLFDIFCPKERCSYNASDGQLLYRDEFSHPSVEAVRLSAERIRWTLTSRPNSMAAP